MARGIRKNCTYIFWLTSSGNCWRSLSQWLFLWILLFYHIIFLTFGEILGCPKGSFGFFLKMLQKNSSKLFGWPSSVSASSLLPRALLPKGPDGRWHWDSGWSVYQFIFPRLCPHPLNRLIRVCCFQLPDYRILIPFKKLPSHGRPSTQFLAPLSFFTFGDHVRLGPAPRAFESVTCCLGSDLSAEMEWMDCPTLSLWTRGNYLPMALGKFFSFSEFWAKGHIWLHNNVTDLSGSWNYVEYAVK